MCNYWGIPVNCGPNGLPFARNYLYKNQGDGTFRDVTVASGIAAAPSSYGMTAVAADFTGDGWTDLYLASDSTPSLLFINQHNGTFREEGTERGVAFSDDGKEQAGMGVAIGDYMPRRPSGYFQDALFRSDTDVLYRNDGQRDVLTNQTLNCGTRGGDPIYSVGATGFADLDNDGWPDIFIATGSLFIPRSKQRLPQYPLPQTPRLIFRNLGNGKI